MLTVKSGETSCLSTSQGAFVCLLSSSINDSSMRSLLCFLLLAPICYSVILVHAEESPPMRLKCAAWGFDLAGGVTSTKPCHDFFRYATATCLYKPHITPSQ